MEGLPCNKLYNPVNVNNPNLYYLMNDSIDV